MKKIIIIGNGIATDSLLVELMQISEKPHDITVFGDEATPAYNRVLLSNVLAGEESAENIALQTKDWYCKHGIVHVLGTRIISIDYNKKSITCNHGNSYTYDALVISTGASSRAIDIPGKELEGVMSFRSIADAQELKQKSNKQSKTVVLGGGLLGLEAAAGLAKHSSKVTVVHRNNYLMNRQLDTTAAQLLQAELENKGISFQLGRIPIALTGAKKVNGVMLDNSTLIEATCVVQAAGIQPNITLAQRSNIPCSKGVMVNDHLKTAVESVFALGECCEHQNRTVGLVSPIRDQAKVLASVLNDKPTLAYKPKACATQLKVSGIELFSAGELTATEKPTEELSLTIPTSSTKQSNSYRKILIKNNQLAGVVLLGDTSDSQWYFELLQAGVNIRDIRENLLFGQAFCA